MFNVKRFNGTFKGIIGECMFKLAFPKINLTNFYPSFRFLSYFNKILTLEQYTFLKKHWYSIDAIEVKKVEKENGGEYWFILYEIKTRNRYTTDLYFKPKMTLETHKVYHEAEKLGFVSKIATIWLETDWNYSIELQEYKSEFYCIDKPKKYDKKVSNYNSLNSL